MVITKIGGGGGGRGVKIGLRWVKKMKNKKQKQKNKKRKGIKPEKLLWAFLMFVIHILPPESDQSFLCTIPRPHCHNY